MTPTDPRADAGTVLIRAWVEPDADAAPGDAVRARVITDRHTHQPGHETTTAAGVEPVVAAVRDFLTELADGAQTEEPGS